MSRSSSAPSRLPIRVGIRRVVTSLLVVVVAFAATAPALYAATDVPSCGFAEIVGVVTGSDSGLPLDNIEVNGVGPTVTEDTDSNASGRYTLTLPIYLERGPYTVLFDPPNNSPYLPLGPINVNAISGTTTVLDGELILGGTIRGRVTAQDTGDPLEGVRVRASGVVILEDNDPMVRATDTDANGEYILQGLIGGDYVIRYDTHSSLAITETEAYQTAFVGGGNYPSEATIFPVTPTQTITVDIVVGRGATLAGEVRRNDTDMPVTDVLVDLYLLEEDGSGHANFIQGMETTSAGLYQFPGLASGDYLLLARPLKLGFGPESPNIDLRPEWYNNALTSAEADVVEIPEVSAGEVISLDLTLDPGAMITGFVTDADTGLPIEGIGMDVRPRLAEEEVTRQLYPARTTATGYYSMTGLYEGTYGIIYEPAFTGYSTVGSSNFTGITLTLGAGGAANVNFTLRRGGGIEGTLTSNDGEPLDDIQVSLIAPDTGRVLRRTTSNASGVYNFVNIAPGDYHIKYDRFEPCGCYNNEFFEQGDSETVGVITVAPEETTAGINRQLACNAPPAIFEEMYLPRVAP